MRLNVSVIEGDWAVFDFAAHDAPYGIYSRRMSGWLDQLITTNEFSSADGIERWRRLDARVNRQLFEVSVPDTGVMTVEDLKNYCLAEARRVGAALPEHGSASSPSGTSTPRITVISWKTCGWITDFWLSDAVTGERFPEDLRVSQTELSNGDLLILSIREYKPDGLYSLIRTPNPPTMLHWLRLAEIPSTPVVTPRLWGALLYTEADVELATYVRTYFDDLNALSGPATRIFVVERRTNWSTAKKYWRRHLEPELYRAMSTLRWLQWTPYDPHGAYEIADLLGISPELLPCLVFFRSSEGPQHEGEKIVFRIEHTSTEYFRSLFGRINTVLRPLLSSAQPSQDRSHGRYRRWSYSSIHIRDFEDREAEPGSHRATSAIQSLLSLHRTADAAAFATVRAAEDAIKAGLLRIVPSASVVRDDNIVIVSESKGAEVTENIHIHSENTTVINHPQDTVIQDFQNTHSKSLGINDLARLLQLVVSSRDLTAPDRDEAMESIRDLAQLEVSRHPALPDARTRLERLRSLLATSADIAQPALEIIASLMRLFGV